MFRFVGHRSNEPALIRLGKEDEKWTRTWNDYQDEALLAASALYQNGVKPGDFVAIIALNLPESFFVMLGTILLGAVPVPINVPLIKEPGQKDLKAILNDCRPKLVLANRCLDKYLADIDHQVLENFLNLRYGRFDQPKSKWLDDELLIMPYTSGTTGGPKGVMLSAGNISDRVEAIARELNVSSSERVLSYLSLGHISELVATFFGQLHGGYCVYFTEHIKEMVEDREKFRAAFPSVLQAVRPTVFLAVPKVWINFRKEIEKKTRYVPVDLGKRGLIRDHIVGKIKDRLGFDKTRRFVSAGSKLSQKDENFFAKLGIYIDDIYGQTETAGPLTLNGRIIGKADILIGEDDEILVEGPNVMLGYFNKPEATAKVLEKGVYRTGDVGMWMTHFYGLKFVSLSMDPEARVFYGGRLNDSFKLAQGEFIPAEKVEELEDEIRKIGGVDEAIVCGDGKPHLCALVFSSKKLDEAAVWQQISRIGEGLFRIKAFAVKDTAELEFTPTLKVKRKRMIQKFQHEIDAL